LPFGGAALESSMKMLDAFIIEEIKRREADRERAERARPKLEIPRRERPEHEEEDETHEESRPPPDRGVVVIDL
jgi:hypothetical protein